MLYERTKGHQSFRLICLPLEFFAVRSTKRRFQSTRVVTAICTILTCQVSEVVAASSIHAGAVNFFNVAAPLALNTLITTRQVNT